MAAVRKLVLRLPEQLLRGHVTLVPVANPAAFLRGARAAEDELDLARVFPGNSRGSVTERAAATVAALIREADYYIDLHTGGAALCLMPLVGYMLHSDAQVLDAQRRMARAFNLPVIWGTDGRLEGRSLSAARDANVPAIYAEYLGGALCRSEGVTAYVDGCLNVLAELGMIDRERASPRVQYVVEDARPGSGRLQICYPAPKAGFFEPAVELGAMVSPGSLLGHVVDPLGDAAQAIPSEQHGMILGLRVFPRVLPGDALAVVLEIAPP
jgi:predicted deacylase